MKQHKWHKEIKAWADGAEIEMWYGDRWEQVYHAPDWFEHEVYRIKPQEMLNGLTEKETNNTMSVRGLSHHKEPQYLYAYKDYVRDDGSTTSKIIISRTQLNTENYIGKIKLEVEDGN